MRSIVYIFAGVLALATEASVRFTSPAWRPDIGLSAPILADSEAMPFEMPKAQSFLVAGEKGERRLEDRFDTFDLWLGRTLCGRWCDTSGNTFFLAKLATRPPSDPPGTVRTRTEFSAMDAKTPIDPHNLDACTEAAHSASPVDLSRPVRPRRSQRRNMTGLFALPSTNAQTFAAIFRPRSPERMESPDWYMAVLVAADGEPLDEAFRRFDEDFLDNVSIPAARARPRTPAASNPVQISAVTGSSNGNAFEKTEACLLREAVRLNVANYDNWHFVAAGDVTVIDNLDLASRGTFIPSLTNSLPLLRSAYAACVPAAIDTTGQIAVVRVFATREEYLAYVGLEHKWTAALWDTLHRELVLYLPPDDTQGLLQTVWHEAFHQYLAYAAALVTAAPWFNEGHAELFEHSHLDRDGKVVFDMDQIAATYVNQHAEELADILPEIFRLGYEDFYSGTQEDIAARYRLAWSLAYFLEIGAPKIRFQPFANLRRDYVKALVETRSPEQAGRITLEGDFCKQLIAAWLNFWRKQ